MNSFQAPVEGYQISPRLTPSEQLSRAEQRYDQYDDDSPEIYGDDLATQSLQQQNKQQQQQSQNLINEDTIPTSDFSSGQLSSFSNTETSSFDPTFEWPDGLVGLASADFDNFFQFSSSEENGIESHINFGPQLSEPSDNIGTHSSSTFPAFSLPTAQPHRNSFSLAAASRRASESFNSSPMKAASSDDLLQSLNTGSTLTKATKMNPAGIRDAFFENSSLPTSQAKMQLVHFGKPMYIDQCYSSSGELQTSSGFSPHASLVHYRQANTNRQVPFSATSPLSSSFLSSDELRKFILSLDEDGDDELRARLTSIPQHILRNPDVLATYIQLFRSMKEGSSSQKNIELDLSSPFRPSIGSVPTMTPSSSNSSSGHHSLSHSQSHNSFFVNQFLPDSGNFNKEVVPYNTEYQNSSSDEDFGGQFKRDYPSPDLYNIDSSPYPTYLQGNAASPFSSPFHGNNQSGMILSRNLFANAVSIQLLYYKKEENGC
jgi:hypothetical protein